MHESKLPAEINSAEFMEYCFALFEKMAPIHFWLRKELYKR